MRIELPLTPGRAQELCDAASPHTIPALVDCITRLQDVVVAVRDRARKLTPHCDRYELEDFARYARELTARVVPPG